MPSVQVIPGHLIDAHGEHGFEAVIDPLVRDPGDEDFVDVENRRMPQIEDQGCRNGLGDGQEFTYPNGV